MAALLGIQSPPIGVHLLSVTQALVGAGSQGDVGSVLRVWERKRWCVSCLCVCLCVSVHLTVCVCVVGDTWGSLRTGWAQTHMEWDRVLPSGQAEESYPTFLFFAVLAVELGPSR